MKLTKEELRVRIDKILSDAPVIWYEIVYGLLLGLLE